MPRLYLFLLLVWSGLSTALGTNPLKFSVDLTKITDDRLKVELQTPNFSEENLVYSFPKMVPGTYKVYDFGRFVEELKAFDQTGNELKVEHPNSCDWIIPQSNKLAKIEYWVNDTWDADTANFVFEPAGTNFQTDTNVVLNNHTLFGYFKGKTETPYEITVKKPSGFYGATSLISLQSSTNQDVFKTIRYNDLIDAPLMYCKPDTTAMEIGGAQILFSVYSPNKQVSAKFVGQQIKPILEAAKNYLGGQLPIKKYAFIIYLFDGFSGSGSAGALEHSYSSMYFLPEQDSISISQTVRDVAAHEFYHIITPLNIHSEEIGNFDFSNPKMSRHLWLYEGVTEYTAHYVQLREKLKTEKEFMEEMQHKIRTSRKYFNDSLPFTEMSLGCLGQYEDQYQNVYEKGALIGLCLDVKLRQLTKGAKGLQDIINSLAKKYPKEKSFKDPDLIPEIVALTFPEIGEFFKNFIEGNKPLPFEEIFSAIGYSYRAKEYSKDFSFGSLKMIINQENKRLIVYDTNDMDDFGKLLGFKVGDQIMAINGKNVNQLNFREVKTNWYNGVKEGDLFKIKVMRMNENGHLRRKVLKARAVRVQLVREDVLEKLSNPSPEQVQMLNWWIGKS
jgi:predicted metalloprotease with PDZ domain